MDAQGQVRGVWIRVWDIDRDSVLVAEQQVSSVPDEMVHHLLGRVLSFAGGSVSGVDRGSPISVYLDICLGCEVIPF